MGIGHESSDCWDRWWIDHVYGSDGCAVCCGAYGCGYRNSLVLDLFNSGYVQAVTRKIVTDFVVQAVLLVELSLELYGQHCYPQDSEAIYLKLRKNWFPKSSKV